jgi:hypothetical protein
MDEQLVACFTYNTDFETDDVDLRLKFTVFEQGSKKPLLQLLEDRTLYAKELEECVFSSRASDLIDKLGKVKNLYLG